MSNSDKNQLVLVSEIYPDNIFVLPLENRPVFPGLTLPLYFSGKKLIEIVEHSLEHNNKFVGVSYTREANDEDILDSDLHATGTLLKIQRVINKSDDGIQILAQAVTRFHKIKDIKRSDMDMWQVQYEYEEKESPPGELKAYTLAVINSVKELIKLNPMFHEQIKLALSQVGMEKPGLLMDLVASFLTADSDKLQEILEATDLFERSEKLMLLLKEEIELNKIQQDIQKQIEEKVSKHQREFFLREQLKVIKKEHGLEKDDKSTEIEGFEKKIKQLKLTPEAKKVVDEELEKMKSLESGSAEFQVTRSYLTWLTDLPWGIHFNENYDLVKAEKILDEIDKIGASFQGDPAAALLEVLDPEQNSQFLDHYLDVRFDLSNILFVTTANQLDTIPRPLLDRMEVIKLSGYILEEKVEIAKRYLIPKQRIEHGLKSAEVNITDKALARIADGYAREAGVRNMENQIKKIMRKSTLIQAQKGTKKIRVSDRNLTDFLGQPVFTAEELYKNAIPGVTLGLAWTAMGGVTLYIEASGVKSKSQGIKQTGQLGKVMQESVDIAYSYVRSLGNKNKAINDFFNSGFIHLHVPAGATPKDGPSAGITMALALYSLAINEGVRKGIGMTGELTLTGRILPIGGVREKTIAARRVKVFELIFPAENKKDFDELPEYLKDGITPYFVNNFDDVLKIAYKGS